MKKRTFNSIGKALSASLAIVLASCLIFQEQTQKNTSSTSTTKTTTTVEETKNETKAETQNLVHSIQFQTNEQENIDISTLSVYDLDSLLEDVKLSRTNPIFFATSKAGPPPAVNNTYKAHLKKGDPNNPQKETVNLSKIEESGWVEITAKLKSFHLLQTTSSVILSKDDGSKTEFRGLNKQQIEEALLQIDNSKMDMVTLSTSKSLAPATVKRPSIYQLEITPNSGDKISIDLSNMPNHLWQIQKSVLLGLAEPDIYMDYSKAGELVHEAGLFGTP